MNLGILKEGGKENRVALLPEGVAILSDMKVNVLVQKDAGINAFASDKEYEEAGAKIDTRANVIAGSEVLIKVNPIEKEEAGKLKNGQVLLSVMNPFFNIDLLKTLKSNGITTFGMDIVPRTTRAQAMDVLSSMATVSGYKAVLNAAGRLPNFFPMFMSAAGTIRPSKVLILGAGVAGLQAIATAKKLGAVVEVFDVRAAVKEEVMSLGGKFIEVEGSKDEASAGGYAVEQTEEFKKKQAQAIHDHAIAANVVICTAQIPGRKAPLLINKETVEQMKPGSLIIDLAASTGGNCEVTKDGETISYKQVTIVGNSNYPSEMPTDASRMFGKNIINFLKLIITEEGKLNLNFEDDLVHGTCLTHNNEIVNERIKDIINQ
ncbi:MAG: Re/Si-specific NAD(P)(+) transhydrogenase subunit alpha [Bacteroidota bacterium]|nr:Re/Si-specific NAD(P)(+) transhydrogenase subunit alpha [Bacteroidota bacterium]